MRSVRGIVVAVCVAAGGLIGAAPASAAPAQPAVASVETPTRPARHIIGTVDAAATPAPTSIKSAVAGVGGLPLSYQGGIDGVGVTTGAPQVYVVFWGAQWGVNAPASSTTFSNDTAGVAPRVKALLDGIGTNNELWSGVMTQYCEGVPAGSSLCPVAAPHVAYPGPGVLAGIWYDNATVVSSNASASGIAAEAVSAAAHFGNTTAASNRNTQYVIVSAKGTHPDGFNAGAGFCAWHDYVSATGSPASPYGDLAYTNLPYMPDMGTSCGANFVNSGPTGLLDGVTMVEGHEYAETITDQLPVGGWIDSRGEENADKCTWISAGPGRSQNVTFATGTFAMQTTWSNDGSQCLISHAIWGVPGLPDDFMLDDAPHSGFTLPGGAVTTQLSTATATGNPQNISLSATDLPADTTATFSATDIVSDEGATVTITTSPTTPLGQYTVELVGTGATTTHAVSFTVIVGSPPTPLQNGVAVNGLSGLANSDQYFVIDLPDNMDSTDFSLAGGTGNADLSIEQDVLPTDSDFACRSRYPTTSESCHFFGINGRWLIRVHGVDAFAGASLQVTAANPTRLLHNTILKDLSGAAGSQRYYWIHVLGSAPKKLNVSVSTKHGKVGLAVRLGTFPTPFTSVCVKPRANSGKQRCNVKKPVASYWYIAVYGVTAYDTLTLKATYS